MKKIILSLVAVTLSVFFVGLASATGDGIHNGTSFKFPNSSGFKSEGSFWGGSTGDANASGVGNDLESKTFSTGTSEGNFGSTFDGKKLKMEGDVNVSQGAGAFNSAQGGDHVGSYTSSEISGGAGMNGFGKVWSGKANGNHNHGNHNGDDHHHHDHNHGNNHDND